MSQIIANSTRHLAVDIDKMLEKLSSTPSKPSMFRVVEDLRSINPKAYDPEIIAIGPFHHGNMKFQNMEQHKVRYLKLLLQRERDRGNELSAEKIVNEIRKKEEEARICYPEDTIPDRDEFVQMLILDGCFVIEFLRKLQDKKYRDGDDPIFEYEYIQSHLLHDLILFENQIPFSIIESLFSVITINNGDQINSLNSLICPLLQNGIFPLQDLPQVLPSNSRHLLGIVHDIQFSSLSADHMKPGNNSYIMVNINSAVELQEAGISFKKLKQKEDINSLFRIEYGNKVMKIPEWKISDSTESLFRNLIAYEYYLPDTSQRYVSDYVYLMTFLVRSPEDAKLLRRCGIISNLLGSDEMVYDVISKLGKNIMLSAKSSYLEIFSHVNCHCEHPWNRWMANLRRKYFNGPWAIISVIAAATLVVLTITQTVFAILSFSKDL